jgi:hypothetical protein
VIGMLVSIYEALGVHNACTTAEVKAAVRRLLRQFWRTPRDPDGDTEQAIRFLVIATTILSDPVRRANYDAALEAKARERQPETAVLSQLPESPSEYLRAGTSADTRARIDVDYIPTDAADSVIDDWKRQQRFAGVEALALPLTEEEERSPLLRPAAVLLSFLLLWFGWARLGGDYWGLHAFDALWQAVAATVLLAVAAFALSRPRQTSHVAGDAGSVVLTLWKRDKLVFVGSEIPEHDPSWLFRFRLFEMTRSMEGYVTAALPLRRIFARMVDYAYVALFICLLISGLLAVFPDIDAFLVVLRSPLFLPVLVTLGAMPLAAASHLISRTTPAKALLGIVMVMGATKPAELISPTPATTAWRRARDAAVFGLGLGMLPAALLLLGKNWRAMRDSEPAWDASSDTVVLARPLTMLGTLATLVMFAASATILLSMWDRDYLRVESVLRPYIELAQTHWPWLASFIPARH